MLSAQENRAVNQLSNWQPLTEACQCLFAANAKNLLFGKNLKLTSSKFSYNFNHIWTHMNLEKKAMDKNDQINFNCNCQKKNI